MAERRRGGKRTSGAAVSGAWHRGSAGRARRDRRDCARRWRRSRPCATGTGAWCTRAVRTCRARLRCTGRSSAVEAARRAWGQQSCRKREMLSSPGLGGWRTSPLLGEVSAAVVDLVLEGGGELVNVAGGNVGPEFAFDKTGCVAADRVAPRLHQEGMHRVRIELLRCEADDLAQ